MNALQKNAEKMAEKIYNAITSNPLEWKKGWKNVSCAPVNIGTGNTYSGTNSFCLMFDCAIYGNRPFFIGQSQLNELLGLKGKDQIKTKFIKNKSWIVVPQFEAFEKEKDEKTGEPKKVISYFRTIPVANLDEIIKKYPEHTDALESYLNEKGYTIDTKLSKDIYNEHKPILGAVMESLGCSFSEGGNSAYFSPSEKRVNMPSYSQFTNDVEWVGTLAHEVGHATKLDTEIKGNSERGGTAFGSKEYALEELVAEFYSVLYCSHFGFEQRTVNNSAAYLQSWLKGLKDLYNDSKKGFFDAVKLAHKNFTKSLEIIEKSKEIV